MAEPSNARAPSSRAADRGVRQPVKAARCPMGAQWLAPTCDGGLQPYGSSSVGTFDGWPPRAGAYFPRAETRSRMGGDIAGSALRCDTVETAALAEGEPTDPRPQGANITGG